jgi:TP901 family phage tail tape measure protein
MAANATMKAALVLSFEDKLSAGLGKLEKQLDQLKKLGEQQTLGKLATGFDDIQKTITATRGLASELGNVQRAARGAYADLKAMTGAYSGIMTQRGFTANDAAMLWGGRRPPGVPERGGGAGGMMAGLAGLGALGGGYAAISSARAYSSIEDLARRAGITKGLSGGALSADTARLIGLFQRDAIQTGQTSSAIGEAYLDLAGMGIAPGEVERLLPIHSRVATAYNIDPSTLSPATAALNQSFGISDAEMGGALAAMAVASKQGRFKVEDFARFLPSIGGNMQKLGMTGRAGANEAFAALETVMKNSADPGSGAANFTDFLNYLVSPMAARAFALQTHGMGAPTKRLLEQYHVTGIDMPKLLENARLGGIDPITAIMGTLQEKLKGLPPDVVGEILGAFFHNQQARDAAQALLMHPGNFLGMQQQLGGVTGSTLDKDFQSRMEGAAVQMKLLDEELTQLNQHLGVGLMPVVRLLVHGLDDLNAGVTYLNQAFPGLGDNVLGVTGTALGLGAALGGINLALPILKGLFEVALLAPARELKIVLAEAADIMGIRMVTSLGLAGAAMDTFTQKTMANPLMRTGMLALLLYENLKGKMNQGVPIDTMTPEARRLAGIIPSGDALNPWQRADQEWVGHHGPGLGTPPEGAAIAPHATNEGTLGTIYVAVDPATGGLVITRTESTGGVKLVPGAGPDPGQTLGRP